ncbi:uncharacterized protein LOC113144726 [Mastacembelus armatus]|uniref:uncharacterized protein LOC113144726 n=1 Tax=Mastacembelus armatus TaxID=205130 RepID=UPI000E45564D|nr:uncharacterized protein LOC113144726 [Mastacembelus armatus]
MIVLWVTLLFLQQGHTLVPVITVELHEPVTFTCVLADEDFIRNGLQWYKQSVGDNLKLILTLRNSQRTSDYSVVQSTVSDPVHPGDSVTLQCSVLSDSESDTCPRNHSVYWFRAGSDESHPNIIYTDGNNECEKRSDTVKSCVYHFSVDISSSDAGTYYCAVATCGQILFGNGTKLDIDGTSLWSQSANAIMLSLIVITFLICAIKKNKCDSDNAAVDRQTTSGGLKCQQRYEDAWDYSAVIFTVMKTDNGAKKAAKSAEREKIYAAVKAFRLD